MRQMKAKFPSILVWAALSLSLTGCGGSKVLKEPEPLVVTQAIASASDQGLAATLDWVIVRDGPGTWAKNADWDQYLMRVQTLSDELMIVSDIAVVDSLGTRIGRCSDRKQCVRGAKEAKRRFKKEKLRVKAGVGAGALLTASAVATATTAAAVSGGVLVSGGTAVTAAGGLILAPVFAVGGIMRGMNNSRVNEQIQSRQTPLPIVVHKQEKKLDLFFPLTPSPQRIEIDYADSGGEHTLVIDTGAALDGLHLVQADR